MTKIILASHHNMAKGLKDTCNFLTNDMCDIIDISAYVDDNNDIEGDILKTMNAISPEDTVVVLVDMIGGSVCQKFYPYISERVHVISGMSLPLALPLVLASAGNLKEEELVAMIEDAKNQIIYVNRHEIAFQEDDE